MPLSPTELAFIAGIIFSTLFAASQWWSKRKLTILETGKLKTETKAAAVIMAKAVVEADAIKATNMVEVVNLVMGGLNLFQEALLAEIRNVGAQLTSHAQDDKTVQEALMKKLTELSSQLPPTKS